MLPPVTFLLVRRYRRRFRSGCVDLSFKIFSASHPERLPSFSISSCFVLVFVSLPSFSFTKKKALKYSRCLIQWWKCECRRLATVATSHISSSPRNQAVDSSISNVSYFMLIHKWGRKQVHGNQIYPFVWDLLHVCFSLSQRSYLNDICSYS